MPETQGFDADIYFGIAADNLLNNFGERALVYADEALRKMRALGDHDGFEMWMGIHAQLQARVGAACRPAGATLH